MRFLTWIRRFRLVDVDAQAAAFAAERTARRAAEDTAEHWQRVLGALPLIAWVFRGREHSIEAVSAETQRRFGPQLVGRTARDVFSELGLTGWCENLDRVFDTGAALRDETARCLSNSGTAASADCVFHVEYTPLRDAQGRSVGVIAVAVDAPHEARAQLRLEQARHHTDAARLETVVQRQRAEAEHARMEAESAREYLRNVLAAIPAGICLVTGPDFVYQFANAAYEEMAGGRPLIGRTITDAFPEVPPEGFLTRIRRVFNTGQIEHAPEVRTAYDRGRTGQLTEHIFSTIMGPLRKPDGSIVGVIAATLEVTDQVRQRERVSALHREAEAARAELQETKGQLETRIAARTVELAETNRALAAEIAEREHAELNRRELLRRLATAREDEQRRVARDLHDQVGQTLTALTLAVQTARSDATLAAPTALCLADVQRLADTLAQDIHSLAVRLRPTVLDDLGLQAALAQLLAEFSLRTHVAADFQTAGLELERLSSEVETVLYRVVQEAITNVVRHARASHVTVIVELHAGYAIAVVEDDGVGCDPDAAVADKRLGLVGMRERTQIAGGSLELESAPGRGTTVIARVPVAGAM
jgi:signal transduction histidine kinase